MDKNSLIRARLVLAQQLLEESDTLPGAEGYSIDDVTSKIHHPRHEREALVVYLLLTCFDLLGQSRSHIDFQGWLSTRKEPIRLEREAALKKLDENNEIDDNVIEKAKFLFECYNSLYGATKAFNAGLDTLTPNAYEHLISSVEVMARHPDSLKPENSNVSYPAIEVTDKDKATTLKRKYLYSIRNDFTHNLSQMQFHSMPAMSAFNLHEQTKSTKNKKNASWGIFVMGGRALYSQHQKNVNKHVFFLKDWPFVLFEVLYSAIGEKFARTQIKLDMFVFDSDNAKFIGSVKHASLPHYLSTYCNITMEEWYK